MKIKFTKMHGAGNDYIYVNTLRYPIDEPEKLSIYNPQIEMFARFKMKSSFHKTKRII